MSGRIVVIGIDACTRNILEDVEFHRDGLFGNGMFFEENANLRLESTFPHVTIPSWVSMFTGREPSELKMYGFYDRDIVHDYERTYLNDDMGLNTNLHLHAQRIWDKIEGDTTILHVPLTFPIDYHEGRMITGMLTPEWDDFTTVPSKLKFELEDSGYPIDVGEFMGDDVSPNDIEDTYFEHRYRVMDELANDDWEFFAYVDMEVDRMSHACYHGDYEKVLGSYRNMSGLLDDVRMAIDEDDVIIVVSDHGYGDVGYRVNTNRILEDLGYIVRDEDGDISPESKVWAIGGMSTRIYFNLEGRDKYQNVKRGNYSYIVNDIVTRIKDELSFVDNVEVQLREDVDNVDDCTPDIMIRADGVVFSGTTDADKSFVEDVSDEDVSSHHREGVFMVSDNIKQYEDFDYPVDEVNSVEDVHDYIYEFYAHLGKLKSLHMEDWEE